MNSKCEKIATIIEKNGDLPAKANQMSRISQRLDVNIYKRDNFRQSAVGMDLRCKVDVKVSNQVRYGVQQIRGSNDTRVECTVPRHPFTNNTELSQITANNLQQVVH